MIYLTDAPKRHSGSRCTRALGLDLLMWLQGLKLTRVRDFKRVIEIIWKWFYHMKFTFDTLFYPLKTNFFLFALVLKKSPLQLQLMEKTVKWEAHMAGHMSHLQNLTYDLFIMGQCHSTVKPPDLSAAQRLLCHPFSVLQSVSHMWEACKWKIHWPDNCSWAIDKRKEKNNNAMLCQMRLING